MAKFTTSMGGLNYFQMDQATLANKSFLWDQQECREDPNLDRNLSLCIGGYCEKASEIG